MKKYLLMFIGVVTVMVLSSCQSPLPLYRSEVKVQHLPVDSGKQRQYYVEIEVIRTEGGKRPYSVSSPHLSVVEGKAAVMGVEHEGTGFTTTALVTRVDGIPQLLTTVTERKGGIIVWSETKKTVIKD